MATYTIYYSHPDTRQIAQVTISEPDIKPVLETASLIWDTLYNAGFRMVNARPIYKPAN